MIDPKPNRLTRRSTSTSTTRERQLRSIGQRQDVSTAPFAAANRPASEAGLPLAPKGRNVTGAAASAAASAAAAACKRAARASPTSATPIVRHDHEAGDGEQQDGRRTPLGGHRSTRIAARAAISTRDAAEEGCSDAVRHRHPHFGETPDNVRSTHGDACQRTVPAQGIPRRVDRVRRIRRGRGLTGAFASSVHHLELGPSDQRNLDQAQDQRQHHRHNKCELDDGAPLLTHPIGAPFATDVTLLSTVVKKDGSRSVDVAQMIRASATAAAATITSAYSAVA